MIRKPDIPRDNLIKLNVFQCQSLLLFGISYFVESTGNICDIIISLQLHLFILLVIKNWGYFSYITQHYSLLPSKYLLLSERAHEVAYESFDFYGNVFQRHVLCNTRLKD